MYDPDKARYLGQLASDLESLVLLDGQQYVLLLATGDHAPGSVSNMTHAEAVDLLYLAIRRIEDEPPDMN